ncbi:LOW QUALITY PROTEIN: ABC transporter F family member 4-like [Penaeus monodon]|uniref:LOW QUALITY PROTEIN: ABC transporter F family member 4-like n=1 Tax=Penaeus monodon TaxID=6687 RepID=UPI0018A78C5A|nr:LOW QUALITY PROTEIN: ABC transporter F family member 4-like [Penaeus monodon]
MVTSMKANHDAECPLEQFLQGKWLVDCRFPLIPASELHNPAPKKRTRVSADWDEEGEIPEKNHKMENEEEEEKERTVTTKKNAGIPKIIIKYQEKRGAESVKVLGEHNKNTGSKGPKTNPTLVLKLSKRTHTSAKDSHLENKENPKGITKTLKRMNKDQEEISPKKTSRRSFSSPQPPVKGRGQQKMIESEDEEEARGLSEGTEMKTERKERPKISKKKKEKEVEVMTASESLGHAIKRGRPRKSMKSEEDGGESTASESLDHTAKKVGRPKKSMKDNEEGGDTTAFQSMYDTIKRKGRPRKSMKSEEDGGESTASESQDHTVKRRGRPRKSAKSEEDEGESTASESLDHTVKRRGRPRKSAKSEEDEGELTASELLDHTVKKRGRPRKSKKDEKDGGETNSSKSQDLIPRGIEKLKGIREEGGDVTSSDSVEPHVKKRGRPTKKVGNKATTTSESLEAPINKRGRPKKTIEKGDKNDKKTTSMSKIQRGPGRPCKNPPQAPGTENPSVQEPRTVAYSLSGRPISGNKMVDMDESDQVSSEDESWINTKEERIKTKKQTKVKAKTEERRKETKEVKKRGRKKKDEVNAGKEKKDHEEEVLKPEDCIVTAKRGTLKYLHQREKYVKALANEVQIEDDFFASKASVKKNVLENLLFSSSPDDSLTIKTPQGKGKKVSSNIITPRTMKLGQWASKSPWSEPITPSTGTSPLHPTDKKEALDVIYQHMKGRKRWPQPIRKVLSESSSLSVLDVTSTKRKLEPLELPTLPEIPEDKDGESSDDDYFNSSEVN